MRIVHLVPQLRLGAGRYVVDLAMRQQQIGHDVHVLVSVDAEPPFTSDPVLVRELVSRGIVVETAGDFFHRDLAAMKEAAARVRGLVERRPWLAHTHTALAAAVARRAGADVVVGTCHGVAPDRPAHFDVQDALAWRSCDRVTTPSAAWARRLEEIFDVPGADVVPVGVDLSRYPPLANSRNDGPLQLVAVAEHTHRKGLDLLIEALPTVWLRGVHATCRLFGRGDAAGALRARAGELDPSGERIVFEGHVERPYDRLGTFDVFVLPSRSDNQPVSAIEALLGGLPLIATDVGGLGELVTRSGAGWVVAPGNAPALADAIVAAAAAGAAERARLGTAGAAYARRTFDIGAVAARMAAIYADAARRRPAA